MTTETMNQSLMTELHQIKEELVFIKKHMVDIDSILMIDDLEAIHMYQEEKKKNKLTTHEELKRELRL